MSGPRLASLARVATLVVALPSALGGCETANRSRSPDAQAESASEPPAAVPPDEQAEASAHGSGQAAPLRYEIRLHDGLDAISERVCFSGPAPRGLTTSKDGERFVTAVVDDRGADLDWSSGVIDTRHLDGGCVELELSVDAMLGAGGWGMGTRAVRVADDLLLSPSYWLWYPSSRAQRGPGEVQLELPEGFSAAIGWRRSDAPGTGRFEIAPDEYDWRTHAVFGRFELGQIAVGRGERFEVAIMGEPPRAGREGIHAWIESSANAVAQLFEGHFPRRRATAIVIPVPGGGGPVHFGLVTRGGDPSVIFFVARDAQADAYIGEWTAVHELSHMAMPLVRRSDAWMSEGFATYYQEILRARAGLYDEPARPGVTDDELQQLAAIERFAYGFDRADRRDGLSLGEASDGMKGGYGRVYWGGALVAFLLDQKLRAATDGQRSLDDVMRAWMGCCRDQVKIWSAEALLEAVADEVAAWTGDRELLSREAEQLVERTRLPDPGPALEGLGVKIDASGDAQLDPRADRAAHRRRNALLGPANARSAQTPGSDPTRAKPRRERGDR